MRNTKIVIVPVQSFSNGGKHYIKDIQVEVEKDVFDTLSKIPNSKEYFLEYNDYIDSQTLVIDKKEEFRQREIALKKKESELIARENEIKEKENKLLKGAK